MACSLLGHAFLASAAATQDLSKLSIEDLTQIAVTSVSKRAQPLSEAPASIYVVSGDDIQRSTATSLAEALRLAPNLVVQQIDARQYAIAARGFNGYETSNKLLGLIDGRSIYTTLHAGIFWDMQEPVLEDIERIEVVSGPGGTLWGPNAVNGVINVISKSALETEGVVARATGGARERTGMLRYGGALGESGGFRVYVSGADRDSLPTGVGPASADGGKSVSGGFRADWESDGESFMAQGEIGHQDLDSDVVNKSHHILGRWTHDFTAESALQVQAYYDHFSRRVLPGVKDALTTYDLTVQHDLTLGRHRIVWGGGARMTRDEFINQLNAFVLNPARKTLWLGNFFVQDTLALSPKLDLIAGLKAEHSSFTGIELLPNVRLAWRPGENTLLWAAASRSVRTPSRIDRNLEARNVSIGNIFLGDVLVGGTFDSEEVIALEAGYRGQPWAGSSLSVSLFYNFYDGLRSTETDPISHFLPLRLGNGLKGHSYGIEAWGTQQILSGWRFGAGITTLHKSFRLKDGHVDIENGISLGNDPDFQFLLRSQADLTRSLRFDLTVRGADSLPRPRAPGYLEADARLGWLPLDWLELYVSGVNLLHKRRNESGDTDRGQLVVRSVYAGTRVRF